MLNNLLKRSEQFVQQHVEQMLAQVLELSERAFTLHLQKRIPGDDSRDIIIVLRLFNEIKKSLPSLFVSTCPED